MYDIMNAILKNMIDQGNVIKGDSMATIVSLKKDYIIELERKDISNYNMAYTASGNLYICIIRFKDYMGNQLFELHLNELQALRIIDAINEYFSAGAMLFDMELMSNIPTGQPGVVDSISVYHNYNTYDQNLSDYIHILEVKEYNANFNSLITKLRIEMDQDKLEALCNVMYFIFLIDIDETIDYSDNFVVANLQNIDIDLLEDIKSEQYSNE